MPIKNINKRIISIENIILDAILATLVCTLEPHSEQVHLPPISIKVKIQIGNQSPTVINVKKKCNTLFDLCSGLSNLVSLSQTLQNPLVYSMLSSR
jgi:hypothetical protein